MIDASAISELERAEHLAYADSKGVKRVSLFNDGAQINAATEEKQDSIVSAIQNITIPAPEGGAPEVNQETLISLIGTLQELCQRLAPLASAMNSGAPGLRVTPNAATLPVSGTVTATVASTVVSSLTNFGTGIPASEMAHDINNYTAIVANINNVTP